jgi:hypothetical protein
MPGIEISALPASASAQLTDVFPVDQLPGPITRKDSLSQVLTLFQSNGQALTRVDDTNVTLTLGGSASTALLNAASLTLGWSGQLGVTRGGTGLASTTANSLLFSSSANVIAEITTNPSALLLTSATGVPSWSASLTNGQLLIGSTGASPTPAALTAGTGVSITNAAGSITISSTGSGYTWTEVTGTSQAMAINNAYIANNAALVTLTLPATAAVGSSQMVQGKGAGGWRIAQNSGQTIRFGNASTTTGVGGSLSSTNRYDSIELVCITANTEWAVLTGPQGIIDLV